MSPGQDGSAIALWQNTKVELYEAMSSLRAVRRLKPDPIPDEVLQRVCRPSVVGGGSVYPAVQNAMLACRAEGLGCVLTTLLCFREEEVRQLLDIPAEWGTCAHVPIGCPVLRGYGPISRRPVSKLTYLDEWGNRFQGSV